MFFFLCMFGVCVFWCVAVHGEWSSHSSAVNRVQWLNRRHRNHNISSDSSRWWSETLNSFGLHKMNEVFFPADCSSFSHQKTHFSTTTTTKHQTFIKPQTLFVVSICCPIYYHNTRNSRNESHSHLCHVIVWMLLVFRVFVCCMCVCARRWQFSP